MSADRLRAHLEAVRKYVEEEIEWGRANLQGEQLENFIRLTRDHYLHEIERAFGQR